MQEALAFHEGFDQRVIEVVFGCPFDDTGIVARLRMFLDQAVDFIVAQFPIAVSGSDERTFVGSPRGHVAGFVARGKLGNRSDEDGRSLERFDIHIRSDGGCKLGGTRFGQSVLRALGVESRGGLEAFFFGKT
ncbi:MAG: hypothetical protein E6760_01575 [Eggerthella sp.]|nr:hypothetical protein [Eggerthella sp.]